MIALSPAVSWAIVGVLIVAFAVWFYAVIKTQKRAEYMSRRWIEEQWRDAISEVGVESRQDVSSIAGTPPATPASEPEPHWALDQVAPPATLYDQDDVDV